MFQFGLFRRVLQAAQSVEDAAGLPAAGEKFGEGQLGERFVVKEKVARIEKPNRAKVRQHQILMVAQVFFDLSGVVLGIGVAPPQGIGAVSLKKRLEFQRQRVALWLGQHEIHPSLATDDLAGGKETEDVFAQRAEKLLGGGLGLGAVLEVEHVFMDGRVIGNRPGIGRERQKFNAFASGELTQRNQNFSVIHGQIVGLPDSGRWRLRRRATVL